MLVENHGVWPAGAARRPGDDGISVIGSSQVVDAGGDTILEWVEVEDLTGGEVHSPDIRGLTMPGR